MTSDNHGFGLRPVPRNWKSYTIITLLILIPLIYVWISTQQSRDSGRDKAERAGAKSMIKEWPIGVQRRVYDLPIPTGSKKVRYFEKNGWNSSSLFVEFTTKPKGLEGFLELVGTNRSALKHGTNPITEKQAAEVGWKFTDKSWWGVLYQKPDPGPDVAIAVDFSKPGKPRVRAVSTTHF